MNLARELVALSRLTVGELQAKYGDVFGETPRSRHREYLIRRIAWRLQANVEGGLTAETLERAAALADVRQVRTTAPKQRPVAAMASRPPSQVHADPRIPSVGTVIVRQYKGRTLKVKVVADGFEHEGERFSSLTAVAQAITGSHLNGYRFFKMGESR